MIDPFGRQVTYLRLSVTDRCDLRCNYCMSENMTFLSKKEVLSLEELERLARAFIAKGVRNVRLTGGEPLVRRGIMSLIEGLGGEVGRGLDELTLTTNATQLTKFAVPLYQAGVRRINVSCDSLNPDVFRQVTRFGDLRRVLGGIEAAQEAGLKVKLNTVALKGVNDDELPEIINWAHRHEMDITLIETMPMGEISYDRSDRYLPLSAVRTALSEHWTLTDLPDRTSGPARYVRVEETGGKLGFITPLTHNFCESCNRIRVTCTGQLFMCLGQDDQADLRAPLRASQGDELLAQAIDEAISRKPKGHDFHEDRLAQPAVRRHMSLTGG